MRQRLVMNDGLPDVYARVCMCPVRQFNVQLYVEKVFIAQKTSEDRGGKVRKRVKDTELLVGLLEKELGGRAEWRVEGRDRRWNLRGGEDTSPDRVIIAPQEEEKKKRREKWYN